MSVANGRTQGITLYASVMRRNPIQELEQVFR